MLPRDGCYHCPSTLSASPLPLLLPMSITTIHSQAFFTIGFPLYHMVVHFYHVRHDWARQLGHKRTFYCKSFCIYYHHYYVASYLLLFCKHEKCNKLKTKTLNAKISDVFIFG